MSDRRCVSIEVRKNSKLVGVFPSIRTGAALLNLSEKKLSDCLAGRQRTTGDGYTVQYWSGRAAHGGRGPNR